MTTDIKILIVTNMYPNDKHPYFGSFVKNMNQSYSKVYNDKIDVLIINPPKSGGCYFNYFFAFLKLCFFRLFRHYDIIHCHHAFCVFMASCLFFDRIIYTNHEGEFFKDTLIEKVKKIAIKQSDHVVFVNKIMRKLSIKNALISKTSCSFIPCPISVTDFDKREIKNTLRDQLEIARDGIVIFFPANPKRKEKNFKFLKEISESDNFYINGKRPIIITGGNIDQLDMWKWYKMSDVVVSCSDFESDGIVYKESILCGIPFVSTDVGNARFYAELSSMGYLYSRNDGDDFRNQLELAINTTPRDFNAKDYFLNDEKIALDKIYSIYRSVL
jgi:glycosyltransferase involved in cell wall biosynthesis